MWKACRRSRVGKFCMWLGLKWNEYHVACARQIPSFIRIERATFFHYTDNKEFAVASDVTYSFMLDYLFHSTPLEKGRTHAFKLREFDPLSTSILSPGIKHFMTVSFTANANDSNGSKTLTALYQPDTKNCFPPSKDFSVYEGLDSRQPLAQRFSMQQTKHKDKELELNALLEACRGPNGRVSSVPTENWIVSEGCAEHTWPLHIFILYASSQCADSTWLRETCTINVEEKEN